MAWSGKYYYRSVRVNGRPRRVYVGAGLVGQGAELIDVSNRVNAAQQRKRIRDTKAEFERIDSLIVPFEFACDTISKSLLLVNGFHQQNRGKWRRKRVEQ